MSALQMAEDGLIKVPAKNKWSSHYDTFINRWILERDGRQVASFPQEEEVFCNNMAKVMNDRSLDVC